MKPLARWSSLVLFVALLTGGPGPGPVRAAAATGGGASIGTLARSSSGWFSAPVHSGPSGASEQIGRLGEPGGPPPVVLVTEALNDGWAHVQLPERATATGAAKGAATGAGPRTGWVSADALSLAEAEHRITIDRAAHRLTVTRRGRVVRIMRAAVGRSRTPTPAVSTFVVAVAKPIEATTALGPFTLHLAAWSETFAGYAADATWDGLVIQGTNCPASCLGRSVTNGSVRVSNDDVAWLARYLPVGTPVRIT